MSNDQGSLMSVRRGRASKYVYTYLDAIFFFTSHITYHYSVLVSCHCSCFVTH